MISLWYLLYPHHDLYHCLVFFFSKVKNSLGPLCTLHVLGLVPCVHDHDSGDWQKCAFCHVQWVRKHSYWLNFLKIFGDYMYWTLFFWNIKVNCNNCSNFELWPWQALKMDNGYTSPLLEWSCRGVIPARLLCNIECSLDTTGMVPFGTNIWIFAVSLSFLNGNCQ